MMTNPPIQARDAATVLGELEREATLADVLAFYDSLPPVPVGQMVGAWRGSGLMTGNPLDGLLEGMSWHGKRFRSEDEADPLVMNGGRSQFCLNPRLVPLGLAVKLNKALKNPILQRMVRPVLPLVRTSKPAARLRMIEYRGVVTATMSYDAQPINDHFRMVDEDTLVGAMDLRGLEAPFMFVLRREGAPQ